MKNLQNLTIDPTDDDSFDRIIKPFAGKTVFVTGGTGFLGKVFVEKILRKCPDIGEVILLIRPKKGKDSKQRLEQIFQNELFEPLLKFRSMEFLLSKTRAVMGDVAVDGLGLSEEDREICRGSNIIVHSAASVRTRYLYECAPHLGYIRTVGGKHLYIIGSIHTWFDQCLKDMVLLNTRGTKCMLDLAKECYLLDLFIHVSTAYCHPDIQVLEERCYPPPACPFEVIRLMESNEDELINILTPKLLKDWPNTYVYSKALAEAIVEIEMDNIPITIVRPSVVVPIYVEPVKGWTDNINGPAGLLIAAGRGVLRTMYGDESKNADFIPVDVFASVLMIITWNCICNKEIIPVLNCVSSEEIRVSWREMFEIGTKVLDKIPLSHGAWYPGGSMTGSRSYHNVRKYLFHWLPAIIVDTILFCVGIKPVLTRVHRRIQKGMEVFEYYTWNVWEFKAAKLRSIRTKLTDEERAVYKIDTEDFDVEDYFENATLSLRRYILKDGDETLPAAQRHMKMLWYIDQAVKLIFLYFVYSWLFRAAGII